MMTFPQNREECLLLAADLIRFLQNSLDRTTERVEWTKRNFVLLNGFAESKGLDSFSKATPNRPEFLWDWTAFLERKGVVTACESEWERDERNLGRDPKHDFHKLFSSNTPVKLFIGWGPENAADTYRERLERYIAEECSIFQRGSVVVVYHIDSNTRQGSNNDRVWTFQAEGDFCMSEQLFRLEPWKRAASPLDC